MNTYSVNLIHTVTDAGHFYFVSGRRVSRLNWIAAKDGCRLGCFITRATREAVRNYCVATRQS